MKNIIDNQFIKKYLWGILIILVGVLFLFVLYTNKISQEASKFLEGVENKTFDLRQKLSVKYKKPNKNIVILGIDESTYEYIIENYGEWPMPRYIYADVVNYIEKQNPKLIAFDLLFVKSIKSDNNSDEKLTDIFRKYKNIYTSMSFDDIDPELRTPTNIDDKFAVNVKNELDAKIMSLPNYRPILKSITEITNNIGHVNIERSEDGIIRDFSPFIEYQGKFYPHLALLIAQNQLNSNTKDFVLEKNYKLKFDNNSYPITKKGTMFLNWYGDKYAYEEIPMAKVIKSMELEKEGKKPLIKEDEFKDKIVYVGSTAMNLNDIKTVPTAQYFPGVETHTTFLNNMLDNNFIHRISFEWDLAITLILSLFIGLSMLKIEYSKIDYRYHIPINFVILTGTLILYYYLSFLLMIKFNLWIAVIMPTLGSILTFTMIYVIRYFLKSKDYEYTYRLATVDGLTDLYNHRYFQEQMIASIENCEKSGKKFSLILTDIDFFKKFNDHYGHQAGDAVLRQVAKILKKNVKKTDFVCRYGGEEMSIILKNVDNENAIKIAQRLCEAVAGNIFKLSPTLESHVTISLGVSTYPEHGKKPTELIEYADKGLYIAKENGRNQVGVVKN